MFASAALCVFLFSPGCVSKKIQPPPDLAGLDRGTLSCLAFLQNADGSWGRDPAQRMFLSGLSTLAFLSRGETPASVAHASTVDKALKYLTAAAEEQTKAEALTPEWEESSAVLVWSLTEAYAATHVPALTGTVSNLLNTWEPTGPNPWALWAAHALSRCEVEALSLEGKKWLAAQTDFFLFAEATLMNRACRALARLYAGDKAGAYPIIDEIVAVNPSHWDKNRQPLLTALALQELFADRGGLYWRAWQKTFWREIAPKMREKNPTGCLTSARLSLPPRNAAGARSDPDDIIFVTAILTLALPRDRMPMDFEPIEADSPPDKDMDTLIETL